MNVASHLSGKSRPLDAPVASDESVLESDVTDPSKLAKLLTRILRELATLRRRFAPRRTDFEDVQCGGLSYVRLPHGFGGRVRWWVVDQIIDVPNLIKTPDTDADTLVLLSSNACTVTIRVEEAG